MDKKRRSVRAAAAAMAVTLLAALSFAGAASVFDSADPEAGLFASAPGENYAPIAENMELETFKNTSVGGTFRAVDPEGDELSFKIVREPGRGAVETDGARFVYTPADGKKGTDSFTFTAVDSMGNCSEEATVTVKVRKSGTKVCYSDMEGQSAAYAAARLAAEEVYIGEQLGGEWFFGADETVSRGEFLAMCLSACRVETAEGVTRTGFADDAETSAWMKPYISAALTGGIVRGYKTEAGTLVFDANSPIVYSEAAVILNSVLKITDVSAAQSETVPVWAAQAAANLDACDILAIGTDSQKAVSRGEAARLLVSAMDLLDSRGTGWSLLDWAR